jgi:glycosyltransferase involved in cell wall biosynthesis
MGKVFIISLHRCGTQSTGLFMQNAGLRRCHWPAVVNGVDYQSKIVGMETETIKIAAILSPVFDAFDVVDDVPVPVLYKELAVMYPDAKFIAVCRNPFDWLRSVRNHCGSRVLDPYERAQYWKYLDNRPVSLQDVPDDALVAMFLRHYQDVLKHFAGRDNFLLVDLGDPEIALKVSSFVGFSGRIFPKFDYKTNEVSKFSRHRFHVLGLPHTISIPEYNVCAFTQKVVRLCNLLKMQGHYVIHYGHEDSRVRCDEHVTVVGNADLARAYGGHDWRTQGFPPFKIDDHAYNTFYANASKAIADRKQKNDFLLCMFGAGHRAVADQHKDMIICEPGIGYAGGHFAPFKIFESYAILHAYLGLEKIATMSNDMWYDVVIPNYFDLSDFEYSDQKDDYFLYLGRVIGSKGVHIAMQVVAELGGRLIVAGPGSMEGFSGHDGRSLAKHVEYIGVADVATRKSLMSKAKAMILPSMFVEPFCGVQIEAMLSGTPVVSTDWGAFAEYNIHGVTGYRCRTFEQFVWAASNIGTIRPAVCREWATSNFSLGRVAEMYDEYWYSVRKIFDGGGWYAKNQDRKDLNWLTKYWPGTNAFSAASGRPDSRLTRA